MPTEVEEGFCEIVATVPTGLEQMAKGEVEEKFQADVETARGKIFFNTEVEHVGRILDLRSVDNLSVIMSRYNDFPFSSDAEEALGQIQDIVPSINWKAGLQVWQKFASYQKEVSPNPQSSFHGVEQARNISKAQRTSSAKREAGKTESDTLEGEGACEPIPKRPRNFELPNFRATCYRTGANHSFQSPEAARAFGGIVQDYFGWNVEMKNFDVEVILTIEESNMYASLGLTKESLHRRNVVDFGYCTLRPTICYGMLRFCKINAGDLVCDPMCGAGTIPIEAALSWPETKIISGDNSDNACQKTQANVHAMCEALKAEGKSPLDVGVTKWDVTNLPLKTNSVDAFITDLPFGKRSGNKMRNWHLYPQVLQEMARCAKLNTGRAALLTHDKKCMMKSMCLVSSLWRRVAILGCNIGGLSSCMYLLHRTSKEYQAHTISNREKKRQKQKQNRPPTDKQEQSQQNIVGDSEKKS